jgi:glycosyltransferase involved in cell wall biosynthesis
VIQGSSVRILHVINQVSGRAGAEVSLRDIVTRSATDLVHAVAVLGSENNQLAPFEAVGVPCYVPMSDRPPGRLVQVRHVRAAIRHFRPDLVHTSLFDADVAGRVAAWIERVPVISSVVNTPYGAEAALAEPVGTAKLRAVHLVDRFLAQHLTSGFHAISEATAKHATQHLGVPRDAVRVVPRGRSREILGERSATRRAAVRAELGWGARPIVINVAREEPQKGQRTLIEALPALLVDHPEVLLVMVGRRGRSSADLDARIEALGLDGSVQRRGVRTDVADLLSAADGFGLPSRYEGLGGAAVEALGLGLPIVASDIPALQELIGQDRGWLVPVGDATAFNAVLSEILRGGADVERRGRSARAVFDQSYELARCVHNMLALYRDIETQLGGSSMRRRLGRPSRLHLSNDTGRSAT